MTFFSRCESSERRDSALRCATARRVRMPSDDTGLWSALAGFAEDLGILFRYAAGLDYYSLPPVGTNR